MANNLPIMKINIENSGFSSGLEHQSLAPEVNTQLLQLHINAQCDMVKSKYECLVLD